MPAISPSQVSFKEILVASDLSDASENAVNYAKAIATWHSRLSRT